MFINKIINPMETSLVDEYISRKTWYQALQHQKNQGLSVEVHWQISVFSWFLQCLLSTLVKEDLKSKGFVYQEPFI